MGWVIPRTSTARRLQELEDRVAAIEARLRLAPTTGRVLESSLAVKTAYEPDKSLPAAPSAEIPWASKSVRISEQLTSYDYAVKTQISYGLIFSFGGMVLGAIATAVFDLPWFSPLVIGVVMGTLVLLYLVIDQRGLVHQLVKDAGQRQAKKSELRVAIKQPSNHHTISDLTYLYLNGAIDRDDLRLIAAGVRDGKSLAVNGWIGVGGWTRTKLDNFLMELERMGYARPGRGNQPRMLTKQGQALFRALAEK